MRQLNFLSEWDFRCSEVFLTLVRCRRRSHNRGVYYLRKDEMIFLFCCSKVYWPKLICRSKIRYSQNWDKWLSENDFGLWRSFFLEGWADFPTIKYCLLCKFLKSDESIFRKHLFQQYFLSYLTILLIFCEVLMHREIFFPCLYNIC